MSRMRTTIAGVLLSASVVLGQTTTPAPVTTINVSVLPATGPVDTTLAIGGPRAFPVNATTPGCNQPTPVPATTPPTNPLTVYVEDPYHPGRSCLAPLPTGLPTGTGYRAVATFVAASCTDASGGSLPSCEGPRALGVPTFHIAPVVPRPGAPTHVIVK